MRSVEPPDTRIADGLSGGTKHTLLSCLAATGLGVFAALHFLNHNFDNIFPADVAPLILAVFAISLLVYGLFHLWLRDKGRATIPTAAMLYLGLNYDGLYLKFATYFNGYSRARLLLTIPVFLIVFAVARLSQKMRAGRVKGIESTLLITVSFLLVINSYLLAVHIGGNWGVRVTAENEDIVNAESQAQSSGRPDIYYIMPDDYGGTIALSETYGFDNQPFVQTLEMLGYYVPTESFSNYPITTTSLASSFSGGLLQIDQTNRNTTSKAPIYSLIQSPETARFLQKQGYTFIQMGSWWYPTQTSRYANSVLRYGYRLTLFGRTFHFSQFTGLFLSRTILKPWLELPVEFRGRKVVEWQDVDEGKIFLEQAQDMKQVIAQAGPPKFVFAHLLMPHLPIVFDRDGKPIPDGLSPEEAYTRQVQFTNQKLIELVKMIQSTERGRQAVVLMASDEGQFPKDDTINASDKELRHKSNTFASIYFPDHDYSRLYPTITPVNYFRVIFNKYFGTHLSLQPDVVYAYRTSHLLPLDLADVTMRLRSTVPTQN